MGFPIFLKKSRVLTKDGFESVLGLSWARFGLFWGYFGSCLGLHFDTKKTSRFVLGFTWVRLLASCCWRWPQELPKGARQSSKTFLKQFLGRKRWFFKNVRISIVKPLFLKLGEAVRELKIDSKRFRKEIKKHIDARDRQRGVKLALRACRQRRVKLALRACRQRGVKLALRENCLGGVVGLFLARFGCSRGPFKAGFGCSRGPLKGRNRLDGCQKRGLKKTYNEEKRSSNISF